MKSSGIENTTGAMVRSPGPAHIVDDALTVSSLRLGKQGSGTSYTAIKPGVGSEFHGGLPPIKEETSYVHMTGSNVTQNHN